MKIMCNKEAKEKISMCKVLIGKYKVGNRWVDGGGKYGDVSRMNDDQIFQ
jgi:hypothetical protein